MAFELLHLRTYTADTLDDYVSWLKWEMATVFLMFVVYPWFISEYTGIRPRWLLLGISVLSFILLVVNAIQPYSLQFVEISRLEHIHLPWGETISVAMGRNGTGYFIGVAFVLLSFFYSLYALTMCYFRQRTTTTLAMLLAIGLLMVTGIEGMLVRMSVINFIHLGPFGILAMIIAMSMALNQDMQNKLRASENRYRSLVEQSPFSVQILSPEGYTVQVNRAWETLWGITAENAENYNPLQDQQLREKGITPYLEQGFAGHAAEIPPVKYNPAENQLYTGPNDDRWVRAYVYPIKDATGAVREVVLLHEDITEKKRFDDTVHLIATGVSGTGERY